MANISSYPLITPKAGDLLVGSETYDATEATPVVGNPTRSITVGSLGSAITSFSNPITSTQYKLAALNTEPPSAASTGVLGEIRVTADYIYVCTATNTWKRTALATW